MQVAKYAPKRGYRNKLEKRCVVLDDSTDLVKIYYKDEENDRNIVTYVESHSLTNLPERDFVDTENLGMYRAADDFKCEYGDGGESTVIRNIWVNEKLKVSPRAIQSLKSGLRKLSVTRKDMQKNGVVEDIIDPCLCPFPVKGQSYKAWRISQMDVDCYYYKKDRNIWEEAKEDERLNERMTYQWIPCKVSFESDGKARFASEIHNLPINKASLPFYCGLEQVLTSMAPMFKEQGVLEREGKRELQIVVKVQRYHLEPGMTYAGRWHTEGMTENISAVGVYYLEVEPGLTGGCLKFRNAQAPSPSYDIYADAQVDVKEGSAVVFSNSLPHRFRMITNDTDEKKTRAFINFFVVDPNKPLYPTTADIPSSALALKALVELGKNSTNQTIPLPIYKEILDWIPGLWSSASEAKRLRQRCRDAMNQVKSGWGWINYGNCGTINFVPSVRLKDPETIKWDAHFTHTCSETEAPYGSQCYITDE
eukprot:TRINITY_DN2899_c0_g1_i3.p1 TRINITY_DN2899_c0_g1~~TRINITY_DN2899_c0_g1_i3.p1  ORF type:complete len:479 (+),score=109.54 TRINITY_DN2899_c0_g1_i3:3833-5269(+)